MSSLPLPSEGAFLLQVLRDCEEDLVHSWCGYDVVELSKRFSQKCVITSEGFSRFSCLDHSRLEPQLQVRYLLRLVSERAKTDQMVVKKLLALLETLKAPSSLVDKLKSLLKTSSGEPGSGSEVTQDSPMEAKSEDIVLTKQDISWLTESLVKVSHKWELIAISLGLLQYERANCKRDNSIVALTNCLECWISNNSNATLMKVKESLCSDTVGETRLAAELADKYACTNSSFEKLKGKSTSESNRLLKFNVIPTIVSTSLPTIAVADGKSTLLQVQVSPSEAVSFQWEKDGQQLVNSCTYSGVDEDILFVNGSQGAEGKYTCCVSHQDLQVCSGQISLTVVYPHAKKCILTLYSQMSEIPLTEYSWPPVVSKKFINLALIKLDSRHKKLIDFSVRGDADDIIAVKEKVEYEEIFADYHTGELILVEGRPGSGKTVLVHKITKDWTLGRALFRTNLTIFVTLRLFNMNEHKNLSEILRDFYSNEKELEAIVKDMERHNGEGICFIFDGLDEYRPSSREKSVIFKLLDRKYLPQSMIIVSSRPSAIGLLKEQLIGKRIEVFGFSKDQISEYIDHFPFDDSCPHDGSSMRAGQLKDYLRSYPNINDMCYLPIHAAMICFLFQYSDGVDLSTQTKVYSEFVQLIVYRHLVRQQDFSQHLDSLKDLDPVHSKHLCDLCALAFNMTINSKQVISSKELGYQLDGRGSPGEERGLGLLTICPTLLKTGVHHSYAFLHLNIAHTSSHDTAQFIDGIAKLPALSLLRLSFTGTPGCIHALVIGLRDVRAYKRLSFEELDKQCLYALGNGLTNPAIQRLSLEISNSLEDESLISFLAGGLSNIDGLELDFSHNSINSRGISYLCTQHLEALNLSYNNIGLDGVTTLANGCKHMIELRKLDLSHNSIGPDGATALAGGFKYVTELETLDLSYNNIGSKGATRLACKLHHLGRLEGLDLLQNEIDLNGAKAVIIALKKSQWLQSLVIHCDCGQNPIWGPNGIVVDGLVSRGDTATISALVEAAQHETRSRKLDLGFQVITIPSKEKNPKFKTDVAIHMHD